MECFRLCVFLTLCLGDVPSSSSADVPESDAPPVQYGNMTSLSISTTEVFQPSTAIMTWSSAGDFTSLSTHPSTSETHSYKYFNSLTNSLIDPAEVEARGYQYLSNAIIPLCPHASHADWSTYNACVIEYDHILNVSCFSNKDESNICLHVVEEENLKNWGPFIQNVRDFSKNSKRYYNIFVSCWINLVYYLELDIDYDILKYDGRSIYMKFTELGLNTCLPYIKFFGQCQNNSLITVCDADNITVGFLHDACYPHLFFHCAKSLESYPRIIKDIGAQIFSLIYYFDYLSDTITDSYILSKRGLELQETISIPCCFDTDYTSLYNFYSNCKFSEFCMKVSCFSLRNSSQECFIVMEGRNVSNINQSLNYYRSFADNPRRYFLLLHACVDIGINKYERSIESFFGSRSKNHTNPFIVIIDEFIAAACLPFYQHFSKCEKYSFLTKCSDGYTTIVFFHLGCKFPTFINRSGLIDMIAQAISFGSISFVAKFLCRGDMGFITNKIKGTEVAVLPTDDVPAHFFSGKHFMFNQYWPWCYNNYMILWREDPEVVNLSKNWSYLPPECQDFLASTIVITPALFDAFAVINGTMKARTFFITSDKAKFLADKFGVSSYQLHQHATIQNGTEARSYRLTVDKGSNLSHILQSLPYPVVSYYPVFNYSNGWFYVFRAQALCLCSCVTVITLFVLSIERFILCWRPLKYKQYYTLPRVKFVILFSWVFGLMSSVLSTLGYRMSAIWHSWTKLPMAYLDSNVYHNVPVESIAIILCVLGILTVIFSALALLAFRKEVTRIREERVSLDMRVTDDFERENTYITVSLIILGFLFVVTYLPVSIPVFSNYEGYYSETNHPVFLYLSWWFLLAGSAINPFIYNMRSTQFKSDIAESLQKILPQPFKARMKQYITRPREKKKTYFRELEESAEMAARGQYGVPKSDQLGPFLGSQDMVETVTAL
ncbi:hypothetical protein SK128_021711 [Halocaridina rubra]|uniref:G-protein coupled receptors family 1 profile domain-containing protein n=1 Tax=Halocaridina rubra TaxID=373956 RepID=A0AAN8X0D5_HALRR